MLESSLHHCRCYGHCLRTELQKKKVEFNLRGGFSQILYLLPNLPMVFQSLELSDSYVYNFSRSQGLYLYRRIALLDGHFSITLKTSEMCWGDVPPGPRPCCWGQALTETSPAHGVHTHTHTHIPVPPRTTAVLLGAGPDRD